MSPDTFLREKEAQLDLASAIPARGQRRVKLSWVLWPAKPPAEYHQVTPVGHQIPDPLEQEI